MKKKSNSTETLILVILILALGAYAAITYLIKPLKTANEGLEAQIADAEANLLKNYATTTSYPTQAERLGVVAEAIEGWDGVFYSALNEEYLIDHIRKNLSDNKLVLISLTAKTNQARLATQLKETGNMSAAYASLIPEGSTEAVLTESAFKKAFEAMKGDSSRLNSEIKTTSMTLSGSGSYTDLLRFLTSIKKTGKTIIIDSLSVELPESITIPTGSKAKEAVRDNPNCTFTVSLVFVDIPAANNYAEKYTAEPLVPYAFPYATITNHTYRTSLSGLAGLLGNLFK